MKKIRKNLDLFIIYIIGIIISCSTVFAATILYQSSETGYDNTNSDLTSDNVQDAIDELYNYCITQLGSEWNFSYQNSPQTWTAPYTGRYQLEVWGAKGGQCRYWRDNSGYTEHSGGNGGYASGEVTLTAGDTLYIVTGGQPSMKNAGNGGNQNIVAGGYNGGAAGTYNSGNGACGSGGGATHIATETGTLKQIYTNSNNNVDTAKSKIYIVAGGGGGGGGEYGKGPYTGGTGGGTTGGNSSSTDYGQATGGSQTAGGTGNYACLASFGQGCGSSYVGAGGGGGGLYGGGASGPLTPGGGGSGYIGGVTNGTMTNGNNSGAGKAKISFLGV